MRDSMGQKSSKKKGKGSSRRGKQGVIPPPPPQAKEEKGVVDRKWMLLLAVIGIVTLVSYGNCVTNRFVFDDIHLIKENYGIRGIEKIPRLLGIGKGKISYRPVRMVSYALDYSLNKGLWQAAGGYEGRDKGLNPWGYHISNIVYHLITTFLVFLVVLRLSAKSRIAFLAAGLFALHPVHTDSITYLSGRRDILCVLFYLLGFYLFLRYRATGKLRFIIATFPVYLLGLGSKEMAVTLPAVFLCYDLLEQFSGKGERINRAYFKEFFLALKRVLVRGRYLYSLTFIGGIAYSYYKIFIKSPSYQSEYYGESIVTNFLTVGKVLVHYIRLLIYPVRLNADYSYHAFPLSPSFFEPATLISFMVLGVVGYVVLRLMVRHKLLAFGGVWFFVTLLPVCQIFPHHELLAEHYLYLPSFGFVLVLAVLIDSFFREKRHSYVGYAAFALVIILFAVRIADRNRDWRDAFTLWSKTVKTAPRSARAHNNLGFEYAERGRFDKAVDEYRQAIDIDNDFASPHNNLGQIYYERGEIDNAILEYKEALKLKPHYAEAHTNLGVAYVRKGEEEKAFLAFRKALGIKRGLVEAHIGMGVLMAEIGILDGAIAKFKKALKFKPNLAEAHNNLASVYYLEGDYKKALLHCERVEELGYRVSPRLLKGLEPYR